MTETASALQLLARRPDPVHALRDDQQEPASFMAFEAALHAALPPRAALPVRAVEELAAVARQRRCQVGNVVARRGHLADACWLLGSGSVALGVQGRHGRLDHMRSVQAAGWLDPGSVLLDGKHVEDIVCETPAVLWQLPAAALRACCSRHPALMGALAASLACSVRQLTLDARALMTKDVLARCATWLLERARLRQPVNGMPTADVELNQRKRSVALQLGTTPETFSRVLSQLRGKGLIDVQGYRITLLDLTALRKLAGA